LTFEPTKFVVTVTDTPGAEGVEYVPETKKFCTSNAGDNTVGVVDLRQMKVIKKLRNERKPDGSAYQIRPNSGSNFEDNAQGS